MNDDDDVYYYIGERLKLEGINSLLRETMVLLKVPRCDTNGVGEVK